MRPRLAQHRPDRPARLCVLVILVSAVVRWLSPAAGQARPRSGRGVIRTLSRRVGVSPRRFATGQSDRRHGDVLALAVGLDRDSNLQPPQVVRQSLEVEILARLRALNSVASQAPDREVLPRRALRRPDGERKRRSFGRPATRGRGAPSCSRSPLPGYSSSAFRIASATAPGAHAHVRVAACEASPRARLPPLACLPLN